jgi:hypothetical protein
MAKTVNDLVLDGAFGILDDGTSVSVCSAEPTTRTAAVTTYMLATTAMTAGTDYTKANGDSSGRKCTMAAKSGVVISNSGTATHIAICDGTNLLYVTTCTSQALTANGSNTVNIPAWKVEIADPT